MTLASLAIELDQAEDHRSLRALATAGDLWRATLVAPARAPRLRAEAFEIVLPLMWDRHTRPLELRKGHRACATAISHLLPECHDGFTDDLESVVAALLAYRRPIANLEGWIIMRMANAIKDGYRARRSREMGAQQRVRVPAGLAARLGEDPWLLALAERVLQWTGVRQAAGVGLWPTERWADDRAAVTGSAADASGVTIAAEVAAVLRAMKEWDAGWYERYVEGPLGRKWAPVAAGYFYGQDGMMEDDLVLDLVSACERADGRLADAAAVCLKLIRAGIADGRDPVAVVREAITGIYLSADWVRVELDQVPDGNRDIDDVVSAVVADARALQRVAVEVLDILALEHAIPPRKACLVTYDLSR